MAKVRDALAVGGILLLFMWVADWRFRHPGPSEWLAFDANDHLGAEYDEIARAIRAGRGFSDPFRVPTGPTAWMAPVLPYVLASIYWLSGDDRGVVVEVVLVVKYFVLLLTGLIVTGEARRIGRAWLGHAVFILGLTAHFHGMFQRTHDEWLLLLVLDGMWLGILRLWSPPGSAAVAAGWGVFGGFAALCSPVAGLTWAATTVGRWLPIRRPLGDVRVGASSAIWSLAIAAICSVLTIMPWAIRNCLVFGKWIPIKSNCAYEIWQSQCLDDDGVVDMRAFVRHPWLSAGEQRDEYVSVGESQFIARRWPEVTQSVAKDPVDTLYRIENRLIAACLWYHATEREIQQGARIMTLKRTAFALPFVGLVIVLAFRKSKLDNPTVASMWIYIVYLLPYAAISYYERYSLPLIGVKMLLVVYGVDTVVQLIPARHAPLNEGERQGSA